MVASWRASNRRGKARPLRVICSPSSSRYMLGDLQRIGVVEWNASSAR
jgi:hypothetical protein